MDTPATNISTEERTRLERTPAPDRMGLEDLVDGVMERLRRAPPRLPLATYRVQLNHQFRFKDAQGILDYLRDLGVSDLYASPFFRARAGSMHGYDLVDHNSINPEIGTREELHRLSEALHAHGMGLTLDFVPNHMGIGTRENAWWMDVLENGPSSLYAPFFDIDWRPLKSELDNKVLLPVLGDHYGRVLENGELILRFEDGAFFLTYWDNVFPVNPRTYPKLLERLVAPLSQELGDEHDAVLELQSILTGLRHLPPRTETQRAKVVERRREKEILKKRLSMLVADHPLVEKMLADMVQRFNGVKGEPRSFDLLHELLEEQAYRLSFWRVAAEEINYRRFFDVNELAAIHMENPAVFEQTHRLLCELLREGVVTGLRIDHPDGLWSPPEYVAALQRAFVVEQARKHWLESQDGVGDGSARTRQEQFDRIRPVILSMVARQVAQPGTGPLEKPLYILMEKILARGERLPEEWPVHGTSGYEFSTLVGGLFVDGGNERAITDIYEQFTGMRTDFQTLVYENKKLILRTSLVSEANVLGAALNRLSERDRHSRDFTLGVLTKALSEVIACFPIYRTYVSEETQTVSDHDRAAINQAIRLARRRNPTTDASVFNFLRNILLLEVPATVAPEDMGAWREFVMKFQQLTGPVMAKGLEDTAFYVYNRLSSLNEVGGEPERFGATVAEFHRANQERQRLWPHSMLTTSTHDTKRSEDVRARISVLSELPRQWQDALHSFRDATRALKADLDGLSAPDANEEYLFYQTLLGSWPFEEPTGEALSTFTERLVGYMRKASREAKVNTSWINPDTDYDAALDSFVRAVLAPHEPFMKPFRALARVVAFHGMWGALSQALLKLTSPGVPDVYQGNEMWDFSLVDPDNRRPVDYGTRRSALDELRRRAGEGTTLADELLANASDGRIKLWVTHVALQTRARLPELFSEAGSYVPIHAAGSRADHVIAFSRRHGARELVVVVPRLTARMMGGNVTAPVGKAWEDTLVPLAEGHFTQLMTGQRLRSGDQQAQPGLLLRDVFAHLPVALLERH